MEASIVIITKNQKEYLKRSLPILNRQRFSGKYEVVVVDSGSTDGAREYALKSKILVVDIPPESFNYANAFNTGAKKAKGNLLIRLSGDCIPQSTNFLNEMIKPFKDKKVGGVFGKYTISGRKGYGYPYYWPASKFPPKLTKYSFKPFFLMGVGISNHAFTRGEQVFELAGGCCAIRKSVWSKRPFNEWLLESEDGEYSWFLHMIGYDIVYNPIASVLHEHKILQKESIRSYIWHRKAGLMFNINIWIYWIRKLLHDDPFKNLFIKNV